MAEVLRTLLARVKTDHGLHVVHRGEELPDDVADGEAERLRSTDALGEPFQTPAEVQVTEAELLRENFEADVEAQPGASEETKPAPTPPTSASTDEEIDAFVADATAAQIVDAASDVEDDAFTDRLVEAEKNLRGSDARKSVLALVDEG